MIKWLIVSFYLFVSLFIGSFLGDDVNVQIKAPASVTAGNEFQVQISLQKGRLESFSRLMQELPAGLKATSVNSANADFTFKDHKVRLIWLKMPDDENVTISYTIKVDPRVKGNFELGGKFSYIDNNERMSVEADPLIITIEPNPDIDPKLIVDINDFKEKVIPEIETGTRGTVASIRQTPQPASDDDNSYIVNLLVYKEKAQKFAKIEETVPAGYTAIKIDSKEGIFVFKDGMAKFLWMSLPSSPYFVVSYRLVPNPGVTAAPVITGQFSYVMDEKTISQEIIQKDLMLASLSPDEIKQLITDVTSTVSIPMADLLPPQTATKEPDEQPIAIAEPEKPVQIEKPAAKIAKQPAKAKATGEIDIAYKLEPEDGVYYRVQIAAGHKPIQIKQYFKKFKIGDEVRAEVHEGWRKYSIGSFNDYKKARDYRVHIWNTTPIGDAFIAAYNTGQRITVQEALMITNQKWYR